MADSSIKSMSSTALNQKFSKFLLLEHKAMGKSTLLNTTFGLNFPVSSGRCTRGAYMQLVKVDESFKENSEM